MTGWGRDTGASLVSALLLVALMSGLAMTLATELRFAMRRSANMEVREQAYWYAMGAREFSEAVLVRALADPERALRPDAAWLNGPRRFPIDRGELVGAIRDGNNCFNLNGLVTSDGSGGWQGDPIQRARFEHLMRAVGIPSADASRIAGQTLDWIDSDGRPSASGAEDDVYLGLGPAGYRTGGTLMAEPAELLALEAMSPEIYRQIEPLVCTRPVAEPLPLNINTLQSEEWPLLAAVFEGALGQVAIDGILLARPSAGWPSADAFWALEPVHALAPDGSLRSAVGTATRYFEIRIDVSHAGQRFSLDEVVEYRGGTVLARLSQSYGSVS